MKKVYNIAEAEGEVLEMLWNFPEGIKQSVLLEQMNNAGKDWKRQTLNTFITRLIEKGLVKREKRHVWAAISKEELGNLQIEQVVEEVYGGKFSKLIIAFSERGKLTDEDVIYLQSMLKKHQKEND